MTPVVQVYNQMRWFILTFYLGSLGLFASEPSKAALQLFQKIQGADSVQVNDELAISSFCGPEKRKLIRSRWEERISWLKGSDFELSPILEKIDGELAVVLLGARSEASPDAASVMALGLVKKGEEWKVTPLEGSFDNAGLGFGRAMRDRIKALEQWMVSEKISAAAKLRQEEQERFRKSMEGLVGLDKLKLEDPEDALVEFLKAAHAGETEQLLVWQGILERDQLPERDWDRDIRATRKGMGNQDFRSAWRVLKSNKVMKVIVEGHGDEEDANYLASFLSTFRTDPRNDTLNPVRFQMFMTDRGWRIRLPPYLAYDEESVAIHREAFDEQFEWEDRNSAREMGYVFEAENEAIRTAEPKEMLEGVMADLKAGDVHTFLQRHYREEERFDDEEGEDDEEAEEDELELDNEKIDERRMERYREALTWWGSALGKKETVKVHLHKTYREGDLALGVFEVGTDESGWKPHYLNIWMAKEDDGWMLLPGVVIPLEHSIAPTLTEAQGKISEIYAADRAKVVKDFVAGVLKTFGIDDPTGAAIDEAGGRKIVEAWNEVALNGSVNDLILKSAVRAIPEDPEKFMRNIGYLRSSAAASDKPDRFLASMVAGRYRAFSMMVNARPEIEPSFPLVLVVPTKDGYRVLTDIELPLETNKGWSILNDDRIKALQAKLSEEDLASIVKLREWHQKVARPAWEQWNLEQDSKAE